MALPLILAGAGLGLSALSGILQAGAVKDAAKAQYALAQLRADSLNYAADISDSQAALAMVMAERDQEAQLFYADYILSAGEIDYLEIQREADEIKKDIYGEGASTVDTQMLQNAKRNVALSGTALQQIENTMTKIEDEVSDVQYAQDSAQSRTLMQANMQAGAAKLQATNELLEGMMQAGQLKAQAAEQRGAALAAITAAQMQIGAAGQQSTAMFIGTGTSLLTGLSSSSMFGKGA